MSSQFSYELDERQIRMLMQDAELDYNDALWNKFDEISVGQNRASTNIGAFIPKFNLSVSRSIVVPIIFVVLIGGLSAMLFSFVDFKKKESIQKEIPYVATVEPIKQPVTQTKVVVVPKPVETNTLIAATVTDSSLVKPASVAVITPIIKKEEPKIVELQQPVIVSKSAEANSNQVLQPKLKKRKVKAEPLPTIDATTNINLNEGASEPELDLK